MLKQLSLVLLFILPLFVAAQDEVKNNVVMALKTGNSKELAKHFIPNIDLTVANNSDVYSKAQAEQILKRFFDENEPTAFSVEHEGVSKMGDRYYIGKLTTGSGTMRVTFFLKKMGEVLQVKQLRIESEGGGR